jgi:hypothetical protein
MEDILNKLVDLLPGLVGMDVHTFYAILVVIVTLSNLLGRIIPDSATGPLGVARKIAKVIGLYLGNRVTPGVSTNTVSRAIAATIPDSTLKYASANLSDAVEDGKPVGSVADEIAGAVETLPPNSRSPRTKKGGPFAGEKIRSSAFAGIGAILLALLLVGCQTPGTYSSPGQVANQTQLDEKAGIAVETMYTALTRAGALAFRTGLVTPSTNPAVQQNNFCDLVYAGTFQPTDRGSQVSALECKLRKARDATRAAYNAANATSYDTAAREAISLGNQLLALLK